MLIAGPRTQQWKQETSLPLILYPIKGNFDAQVKVVINPEQNFQFAGIGVRSAQDSTTWVRVDRGFFNEQTVGVAGMYKAVESLEGSIPYTSNTVYLRIERRGPLCTLSYSTNGNNWVALKKDFVVGLPQDVEIYLYVFSSSQSAGMIGQFYDFIVSPK